MLLIFETEEEFDTRIENDEPKRQFVKNLRDTQDAEYMEAVDDYVAQNLDSVKDNTLFDEYGKRWNKLSTEKKTQILNDQFDSEIITVMHYNELKEIYGKTTQLPEEDVKKLWVVKDKHGDVINFATSEDLAKIIVQKYAQNKLRHISYSKLSNEDNDDSTLSK
jgi:hypothetical protein